MLVGNRAGVGLSRSTTSPLLPSLIPVKEASKQRPHGGRESPVARTGQHPWKMLPTMMGDCSNTKGARCFQCEDNNLDFTQVQPHYYRVR